MADDGTARPDRRPSGSPAQRRVGPRDRDRFEVAGFVAGLGDGAHRLLRVILGEADPGETIAGLVDGDPADLVEQLRLSLGAQQGAPGRAEDHDGTLVVDPRRPRHRPRRARRRRPPRGRPRARRVGQLEPLAVPDPLMQCLRRQGRPSRRDRTARQRRRATAGVMAIAMTDLIAWPTETSCPWIRVERQSARGRARRDWWLGADARGGSRSVAPRIRRARRPLAHADLPARSAARRPDVTASHAAALADRGPRRSSGSSPTGRCRASSPVMTALPSPRTSSACSRGWASAVATAR